MLFVAIACSTMQQFAMVILIPFLCSYDHGAITSYEIGILLAASTAGELYIRRYIEPSISRLGTKWSIQLGFFLMIVASFSFWGASYLVNDEKFMFWTFVCRFCFGAGAGLLRSVIMVARA